MFGVAKIRIIFEKDTYAVHIFLISLAFWIIIAIFVPKKVK